MKKVKKNQNNLKVVNLLRRRVNVKTFRFL